MVGSGGVAVELQPQTIRRAVDDVAQHDVACEVPQKAGRSVLSVVHLVHQIILEDKHKKKTKREDKDEQLSALTRQRWVCVRE